MPEPGTVREVKALIDLAVQAIIIGVPVAISWFIRTYVRSAKVERGVGVIVRTANAAIDYVENLDRRQDLQVPAGKRKGAEKLRLAAEWLVGELKGTGIKITEADARKWVAAEFQKRVGDVRPVAHIAVLARGAVDTVQHLEDRGLIELPPDSDRRSELIGLAADWIITETAKAGVTISREEALTWVRSEMLRKVRGPAPGTPVDASLDALADEAFDFVAWLKEAGRMSIASGQSDEDPELNVALAWLLTECAKLGIPTTLDQIGAALDAASARRAMHPA